MTSTCSEPDNDELERDIFDEETDCESIFENREALNKKYQPEKHLKNGTLYNCVIDMIMDSGVVDEVDYNDYIVAEKFMHKVFDELGYDRIALYFKTGEIDGLQDSILKIQSKVKIDEYLNSVRKEIREEMSNLAVKYFEAKREKPFNVKYRNPSTGIINVTQISHADFLKVLSYDKLDKEKLFKLFLKYFIHSDFLDDKLISRNRKGYFEKIPNFIKFIEYYDEEMKCGNRSHTGVYMAYEKEHKCTGAINKFYKRHRYTILKKFNSAKNLKKFLSIKIDELKSFLNELK